MNLSRASRRIYVATSWKNRYQEIVVSELRRAGHEVYDFKNPRDYQAGFQWEGVDSAWRSWSAHTYIEALNTRTARWGYLNDISAMKWADTCVLVLPSGRSAHLEAGWFAGAGKALFILLYDYDTPELMYKMADAVCLSMDELLDKLTIKVRP